jgi:DNA-directed RNA polymerase beta' subunit
MTDNQLKYLSLQETERHNREMEEYNAQQNALRDREVLVAEAYNEANIQRTLAQAEDTKQNIIQRQVEIGVALRNAASNERRNELTAEANKLAKEEQRLNYLLQQGKMGNYEAIDVLAQATGTESGADAAKISHMAGVFADAASGVEKLSKAKF